MSLYKHILKDRVVNRIALHFDVGVRNGETTALLGRSRWLLHQVGIDGREVPDPADLFNHTLRAASHWCRVVLALIVVRSVDVVAAMSWVTETPVSQSHVIATCDGIVCSLSSMEQVGEPSWYKDLSAGVGRLIRLLHKPVAVFGGLEELIIKVLGQLDLLSAHQ